MTLPNSSPATQVTTPRAIRNDVAAVGATSAGIERHVAPQPRKVSPVAASVVAIGDWDDLFDAIGGRLTAIADACAANGVRAGVLECVEAMGQLHVILKHERACNHQLELDLFDARAALEQARIELAASRSDERRSRHLAMREELTSVPNRSFFGESIDHALVQADPQQGGFAVLYLELDGFKPINDAYGDDVGDELLSIVASRLARAVRAEDVVSRLGGDEFACLLTKLPDRQQLSHLACKLFDAVSAPVSIGPHVLTVRPSIGIAMCPDDGATTEALLRHADTAMCHAKRHGSGYAFFEPGAQA